MGTHAHAHAHMHTRTTHARTPCVRAHTRTRSTPQVNGTWAPPTWSPAPQGCPAPTCSAGFSITCRGARVPWGTADAERGRRGVCRAYAAVAAQQRTPTHAERGLLGPYVVQMGLVSMERKASAAFGRQGRGLALKQGASVLFSIPRTREARQQRQDAREAAQRRCGAGGSIWEGSARAAPAGELTPGTRMSLVWGCHG